MRFAYWTIDEVNQHVAQRLANRAGVELDIRSFQDADAAVAFDAVLYDVDFFPADRRQTLLADLAAHRRAEPIVVHSYRLSGTEARALRRQGVIVVRRLRSSVFARLRAVVLRRLVQRGRKRAAKPGVPR